MNASAKALRLHVLAFVTKRQCVVPIANTYSAAGPALPFSRSAIIAIEHTRARAFLSEYDSVIERLMRKAFALPLLAT
jgi:hypothetical protein